MDKIDYTEITIADFLREYCLIIDKSGKSHTPDEAMIQRAVEYEKLIKQASDKGCNLILARSRKGSLIKFRKRNE